MEEIKMWAQMFFEDGSVTEGKRFPAEWLDDPELRNITKMAQGLLNGVNREEGWLLLWGAGNIMFNHFPTSFVASESKTSA